MAQISEHIQPENNFDSLMIDGDIICMITGDDEPKSGGFYSKHGGYCISSRALENRDGFIGFTDLGITIGDALLDSNIPKGQYGDVIQGLLQNIEQGIKYTINRKNK